jgi:hypothetical protein
LGPIGEERVNDGDSPLSHTGLKVFLEENAIRTQQIKDKKNKKKKGIVIDGCLINIDTGEGLKDLNQLILKHEGLLAKTPEAHQGDKCDIQ